MAMKDYPAKALIVDGDFGSYTVYALQYQLNHRLFKAPYKVIQQDGVFGKETATRLQYFLRDKGYYKRAIDGNAGAHTWNALQRYMLATTMSDKPGWAQPDSWNWPAQCCLGKMIQAWLNRLRGPLA